MKKYFLFVFLFSTFLAFAQSTKVDTTTVEKIRSNPVSFNKHIVQVTGFVTQYIEGEGTSNYYLLKGEFGASIKVNASDSAPEINKKYVVNGILYIEAPSMVPFISEKSRLPIGETVVYVKETTSIFSEWIIYVIIGAIVVLVGLYFILKRKKSQLANVPESMQEPIIDEGLETTTQIPSDVPMEPMTTDDFKTIKITASSPKTLKFIPGKLTIVSGEDVGKSFKIAAFPTPEGSIISIGREEVKGDRSFSHIQLMQKTISRKQAEIIQKDGQLYIKNLSETNLTQVDGIELQPNVKTELKQGSIIRLGELEVKYES
jgi:pSer/pThr/pTyr-binding forkhead associated (FHA) protein